MRLDTLRMFRKAVNSRHGKTIGRAGNMRKEHIPRLTTGSLAFDFALGGGIPVGRVTEIAGETSSGKTTSALRIAALAQKLCANCLRPAKDFKVIEIGEDEDGEIEYAAEAYCDCYKEGIFEPKPYVDEYSDREKGTLKQCEVECEDGKRKKSTLFKERLNKYEENSYEEFRVCLFNFEDMMDMKWLKQIGVDTRLLILDESGTAEEGIDIYDNLIKTGSIHLFILDSIAAMTPSIEVEESTEKDQYAAQAKLVTKFVRKAVSSSVDCARNFGFRPTHIWINQLRDNFGKDAQWNPYKKPGGNAIKFARSVGVHMRPSKWDRVKADTDIAKMYQSDVGNEVQINFKVEKNKTATAQSTGYYIMKAKGRNKGQIDEEKYVLEHAIRYGIYRTEGVGNKKRWFVSDEEYSTKGAALARIEEPAVFEALKKSLLKRMLEGLNSSE